jgi:Homing endonuclease associated repeat/HNH endonuclease
VKFELEENGRGISDEDLLSDLRRCATEMGRDTITSSEYADIGKVHPSTFQRRFGSWVRALELAELKPSRSKIGITDDELMENIEAMWVSLGRQPRYGEVKAPFSRFSAGTYENRFRSWRKALATFVEWVNSEQPSAQEGGEASVSWKVERLEAVVPTKRRTKREISDRQRFRILVRDGFRCKTCGASPLTQPGVELHVDHVMPWSKGGETVDENLQTKCAQCNLGKGSAFHA